MSAKGWFDMTFAQKLARLTECMNKAALCRRAGVEANAIWRFVNRGDQPSLSVAKRIASVLGVDPFWMLNDSMGFPAVRVEREEIEATKIAA